MKMKHVKVQFKIWDCDVIIDHYTNGRPAIELADSRTGEPIARATVNMPQLDLKKDEVCIKDYSENEGMVRALEIAGLIQPPHAIVQTGYVQIPICRINFDPNDCQNTIFMSYGEATENGGLS